MSPTPSTGDFHREYLVRLPLPLAQLYSRAHNSPSARARHDNSFYLFEALIKLSATPLVGAYLAEVEAGAPRVEPLDRLLAQLALPSLGQWVGILRETARHFGMRPDAASHPLGHIWQQLSAKRRGPSPALELFRRIKNGPDGLRAGDESCSPLELFDALVVYRNTVFGHGAGRSEEFYDQEMGPLLFPAASELLGEGVLDMLGPRGSRLVSISELRSIDEQRVEVALLELVGLQSERMAPLELTPAEAAAIGANCVAVLWPGRKAPLRLDPLLVFRGAEFADEVRFLNRDRSGRQVEYLSYTTGRTERDKSMVPAMTRLLSRVTGRQVEEQDLDRLAQQSLAETSSVDALFAPAAAPQRTIGDYEILAELGRGGMGVVYLARQLSLGRLVALKMLPASLAGDEVALARFRREMRALGRCEHPHIVKVLASGVLPDGQIYYAMEYVPGADLEMVWRELSGQKRQGEASTLSGLTLAEAVLTASRKQRDEVRRHSEAGRASAAPSSDPLPSAASLEPAFGSAPEPPIPTLPLPPLPSLPAAEQDAGGYMRRVAQLIRDAAMAVQAVHDQSIVHRDIKPANLMLTPDGSRVVLMDFGLAKGQSLALTKTSSGEFLGTLRYAAPEQLAAAKVRVDYRVDVRALGTTLWELLTRQQAFGDAEDQSQLAAWVLSRDLPQLRTVDPTIDRDLEAIVARAVERDPERRIQTARELAEYLDLYLSGKPVPIRTPGPVELLGRWVREHRPLVAVAAAACLAVVVTVVVAFISILDSRGKAIVARNDAQSAQKQAEVSEKDALQARNDALQLAEKNKELADKESAARKNAEAATFREAAERKRADEKAIEAQNSANRAEQERKRADAEAQAARRSADEAIRERRLADRRLYVATMNLAQLAMENGQSARMQELLARYEKPAAAADDPRGWEWYYLRSLGGQQLRTLEGHRHDVQSVAVSPDGTWIASGEAAEYEPVEILFDRNKPRPPPKLVRKGTIKLWDARRNVVLSTLTEVEGQVLSLAFMPDGKRLISCEDQKLHIRDVATGKELPTKFSEPATRFALRGDGVRLAIVSGETVRIWDLDKDAEVKAFPVVPADLNRKFFEAKIAYSPDGTRLVTVIHLQHEMPPERKPGIPTPEEAKQIHDFMRNRKPNYLTVVWDAESGEALTRIWGAGGYVALSPDGQRFVTAYTSETHTAPSKVRIWDAKTGKPVLEPKEHAGHNFATAAFAPDGKSFCVSNSDVIQVYDATTGAVTKTLRGHKGTVLDMTYSRDGRLLVSSEGFGLVMVWTMVQGESFVARENLSGNVVVHGGRSLLVGTGSRQIQVWQLATDKKIRDIPTEFTQVSQLAISPDGKRVAGQSTNYVTSLYDIDQGRRVLTLEGQDEATISGTLGGPAWSRDGKWVAAPLISFSAPAAVGRPVKIWDAATGKMRFTVPQATCVAFGPDSRRVVTGGRSEPVAVWDFIEGRQIFSKTLKGRGPVPEGPVCVAFAPDGKTVAGGFYNGVMKIWDATTGKELFTMEGHTNQVNRVIYTPDSRRLISASADTTIKLWDTATGMEAFTLRGHTTAAWAISMSADGRWLVSAGGGGVHVRDIGLPLPMLDRP